MPYVLAPSCCRVERLVDRAQVLRQAHGRERTPDSKLDVEVTESQDVVGREVLWAADVGRLRLEMVDEHIRTVASLTRQTEIFFALYTVARTAAEVSARAWWLLNPSLSASDRAARSIADQQYSFQQLQSRSENRERATQRSRELESLANRHGIQPSKRNRRPDASGLLDILFADDDHQLGSFVYELLSAFTHGTQYALLQMLAPVGEVNDEDIITTQMRTGAAWEASVLLMAMLPYLRAVEAQATLHGWPTRELDAQARYTVSGLRQVIDQYGDA